MTAETENFALELLRGMRADMAAMNERFDGIDARLNGIDARPDAVETELEGLRCVFVASSGSLVTDGKDHEARIAALEGAPA